MEAASYSVSELVSALQGPCTSLNACENHISDLGCEQVALALAESQVLTLRLQDNGIGDHGALLLAEALALNGRLVTLSMARNQVGPRGGLELARNGRLTRLDLGQNRLGDEGAEALALALTENRRLLALELQVNGIGVRGAGALADALRQGVPLRELHLRDNRLGDEGAQLVADALKGSNLTLLDLSFNRITPQVVDHLHEAVEASQMTALAVQPMEGPQVDRLRSKLEKNRRTMVLTVEVVKEATDIRVSCTSISGSALLDFQGDMSLQQLHILAGDALGHRPTLVNTKGEVLSDSSELLSELAKSNCKVVHGFPMFSPSFDIYALGVKQPEEVGRRPKHP